MSQASTYFDEV